jgi:D-beta-D-heptose 7-phosphate kinase/D-beta-D-heptose 1-phosphate adenosyltransferase
MSNTIILPNTKEKENMDPFITSKFSAVVETAGATGMYLYYINQEHVTHIEAIEISDVVDTVGAGDTVTAVFTAAIATGATIKEAAQLANIAASVVVRHAKTYAISYAELYDTVLLQSNNILKKEN